MDWGIPRLTQRATTRLPAGRMRAALFYTHVRALLRRSESAPSTSHTHPHRSDSLTLPHRPSASALQQGLTTLHWVASKGRLNMIDPLLALGADINAKDDEVPPPPPPHRASPQSLLIHYMHAPTLAILRNVASSHSFTPRFGRRHQRKER